MTESFPRPSKPFATISAIVIACNLLLLSVCIAENVVELNPFALIVSFVVVPLCALLAVQQYRGTFRRVPSAATTTSTLFYILGGFLAFGLITSAGEAIVAGISLRLMASLLIPMLVPSCISFALGRMNSLWYRELQTAIDSGAVAPTHRGFYGREMLASVGIIAAMTGIVSQFMRPAPPRYAENVEASAAPFGLPAGATDVSYCQRYRGTIAFEFTTDEPSFRRWVDSGIGSIESESAEIPLREISSPFTIMRFYVLSSELEGPKDITISNGLCYSWSKEDRGVYAAYDRTTGRAYYHAHFY